MRRSDRPAFVARVVDLRARYGIRTLVRAWPTARDSFWDVRFLVECTRGGDPVRSLGWQPTPTSRYRRSTLLDRPRIRLTDVGYGSVSVMALRAVRE